MILHIFIWVFRMLSNEYLEQVRILGIRAAFFEQAGDKAKAEESNFAIQDLDFANDPELAERERLHL